MRLTSTRRPADPQKAPGRAVSRALTLVVGLAFTVVGLAAPSMAHHNTVSGTVTCKAGGGWTVTWRVANSEERSETIIASSRAAAVPVGTVLGPLAVRVSTEGVITKPTSPLTLTLTGRWTNGVTATNSGSIAVSKFSDECVPEEVPAPQVPVVDECGPDNARYGTVPTGPWTAVTNPDGSLTLTARPGYVFPGGHTTHTYPAPVDSAQPCPVPVVPPAPVVVPPVPVVVTPPVVTPPVEVLPAQARVVRAKAVRIDKCGRASDLYKVSARAGVRYLVRGKAVREGVWLRSAKARLVIRAEPVSGSFELTGTRVWRFTFSQRPCVQPPHVLPATGS